MSKGKGKKKEIFRTCDKSEEGGLGCNNFSQNSIKIHNLNCDYMTLLDFNSRRSRKLVKLTNMASVVYYIFIVNPFLDSVSFLSLLLGSFRLVG